MCLDHVDKTFVPPPKDRVVTAWKTFRVANGLLLPAVVPTLASLIEDGGYRPGRWSTAEVLGMSGRTSNKTIPCLDGNYPAGFHAFTTRKAACEFMTNASWLRVRRVQLRQVHTSGTQDSEPCLVATEMRVPWSALDRLRAWFRSR